MTALANLFVDGPSFASVGPPAHLALFRRRLTTDPGATAVEWGNRAAARIAEIGAQQAEVGARTAVATDAPLRMFWAAARLRARAAGLRRQSPPRGARRPAPAPLLPAAGPAAGRPVPAVPTHPLFKTIPQVAALALPVDAAVPATLASLTAAFRAAGANATWLPPASAAPLGAFGVPYNLASWRGGQYEFVSCDLPRRGADYVGTCEAKAVRCGASAVDGVPYACTRVADGAAVPGNVSASSYRDECEAPCDLELDCGALCDCGTDGCAAGEVGRWLGPGGGRRRAAGAGLLLAKAN